MFEVWDIPERNVLVFTIIQNVLVKNMGQRKISEPLILNVLHGAKNSLDL